MTSTSSRPDLIRVKAKDLMVGDFVDLSVEDLDHLTTADEEFLRPILDNELQEVCDFDAHTVDDTVYVAFEGLEGWSHFPTEQELSVDPVRRVALLAEDTDERRKVGRELRALCRRLA